MVFQNQEEGGRCDQSHWGDITFRPFQKTELGNTCEESQGHIDISSSGIML